MGRLQWNTVTGRYETAGGVDNPPNGFAPAGTQYVDTLTGETKIARGGGLPDTVLSGPAPTTTAAPKKVSPSTTAAPSTTVAPKAVAPSTTVKPKAGTTPSTTVAPTTTVKPQTSSTTNANPDKYKYRTGPIDSLPTDAGPVGTQYVDTRTGQTKVRRPSGTMDYVGGMGGPSAADIKAGNYVGSKKQVASESSAVNKAVEEALKGGDYKGAMELIAALSASGSGGAGSSGPSAAETARANTNAYRAAMVAAKQQEAAGQGLQTAYNTQAQSLFDTQSAAIKKYYGDINTQASKTITGAGENFLAQLPQATAYANAQVANLPQAQQGLTEALQAYGATTGQADEQSAQSKAYLDALAKMQASSNQQLQTADTAYMGALRTAGQGANTAAQQALAGNIAQLQAGDMSNVTSAQQALIQKGIEAVLAGQTEAASTRANATATYGVPKKTKPPRKPKK